MSFATEQIARIETLLAEIGRAVIRSESNGTSGISSPASQTTLTPRSV